MAGTATRMMLLLMSTLALRAACWQLAGASARLSSSYIARSRAAVAISTPLESHSDARGVGLTTNERRSQLKYDMLLLAKETKRGAYTSPEQHDRINRMAESLAALNPIKSPLGAKELNGRWQLMYTASEYTLRPHKLVKPVGPIHHEIDVPNLYARGIEYMQIGPFRMRRWVDIDLEPIAGFDARVHTLFTKFRFGFLGLPLPVFTTDRNGHLDITYLDKDFRLARGDKGNLLVTVKDDR